MSKGFRQLVEAYIGTQTLSLKTYLKLENGTTLDFQLVVVKFRSFFRFNERRTKVVYNGTQKGQAPKIAQSSTSF